MSTDYGVRVNTPRIRLITRPLTVICSIIGFGRSATTYYKTNFRIVGGISVSGNDERFGDIFNDKYSE